MHTKLKKNILYLYKFCAKMSKDLFSRYVWIVDTISRHNGITRERLNTLWMRSPLCDGRPIPERTFYHHRRAIEECFSIDIGCNAAGEYYIEEDTSSGKSLTNWMLDSYAVNSAMGDVSRIAGRIQVEDVPSAREFLPLVIEALRDNVAITFTYAGFNRSRAEKGILFYPWMVKLYKQRWYMLGYKVKSRDIRTYALDRVREMQVTMEHFTLPEDLDLEEYFGPIIGVTSSKADIRTVRIRTTPTQAKYLRALPLHKSQMEEVHDDYSIFTYRLKLNYELVHELLAFGPAVTVLEPRELRIMLTSELRDTLANYEE